MSSTQPSDDPRSRDRPPGFGCVVCAEGPGFTRVTLTGELDLATVPKLAEALADVPDGSLVVTLDLRELVFMDSSGLQAILVASARLAEAACRLVVVPGGRQVQRIFEITGTNDHLEFMSAPNARDLRMVRSS